MRECGIECMPFRNTKANVIRDSATNFGWFYLGVNTDNSDYPDKVSALGCREIVLRACIVIQVFPPFFSIVEFTFQMSINFSSRKNN